MCVWCVPTSVSQTVRVGCVWGVCTHQCQPDSEGGVELVLDPDEGPGAAVVGGVVTAPLLRHNPRRVVITQGAIQALTSIRTPTNQMIYINILQLTSELLSSYLWFNTICQSHDNGQILKEICMILLLCVYVFSVQKHISTMFRNEHCNVLLHTFLLTKLF